ncbi:MAG TPA: sigma-70 family RNA polymerase sigma factor [Bryobacteraceae bacterium]|nr:sigma-70 family RNA polymerase sigma factor [Bryobacteraceae bacterium]
MGSGTDPDITRLLQRLSEGDKLAEDALIPHVYEELRQMAKFHLLRERPGHTLQPTALVHEVYLRLTKRSSGGYHNRAHFFAMAAKVMRGLLVDYARQRKAEKRGGSVQRVELPDTLQVDDDKCDLILGVHTAIERLERRDERQARIVVMRFFGGLTEQEIALLLGVSQRTVKRDWVVAKAWLAAELRDQA